MRETQLFVHRYCDRMFFDLGGLEVQKRFELLNSGVADHCLTTWLLHRFADLMPFNYRGAFVGLAPFEETLAFYTKGQLQLLAGSKGAAPFLQGSKPCVLLLYKLPRQSKFYHLFCVVYPVCSYVCINIIYAFFNFFRPLSAC